jgi:hypothetical protein
MGLVSFTMTVEEHQLKFFENFERSVKVWANM